jgi:hypothetical protein
MSVPDFKLKSLIRIGETQNYLKIERIKPKTEALVPAVDAFLANIKRIQGLAYMPLTLYAHIWHLGRSWTLAGIEKTGTFVITPVGHPQYTAVANRSNEIRGDTMSAIAKVPHLETNLFKEAAENIELLLGPEDEFEHLPPWLGSMLISEWSAFEILATDLWVAAVNCRPDSLGVAAIKAPKRKDDDSDPEERSKDTSSNSVSLDYLRRYGYNLSNKMGDMLKAQRKWSFNSSKSIKLAYVDTYGKDIKPLFDGTDFKNLATLEAARNLLVHRAGFVDSSFRSRVKNDLIFSQYSDGERLKIDGEMVTGFFDLAINFSCKMIEYVETWMGNHAACHKE